MARNNLFRINVKAAAITGAVIAAFSWLLTVPYSFGGYGMIGGYGYPYYGGMMGYFYQTPSNAAIGYPYYGGMMGYGVYGLAYIFYGYGFLSAFVDILVGGALGAAIALIYGRAQRLWSKDKRFK
jgi:hypothetical protein